MLGGTCALVEAVVLQPTLYWKHARMQGLPMSLHPRVLWRGTGASMCNEFGQTGLQFVTTGLFRKAAVGGSGAPGRELTAGEDAAAAMLGGVAAAVFVSPVELVMLQQQRFGGALLTTPLRIYRGYGVWGLARGFVPTAARDAVYCAGMLSATPLLRRHAQQAGLPAPEMAAAVAAAMVAGVLSCPFDAVKACMKGDLDQRTFGSMSQTVGTMWRDGGARRLFRGVEWRCANLAGCFFIIDGMEQRLGPRLFPDKWRSGG